MSTILRSLRNLRRVGLKDAAHQMANIGMFSLPSSLLPPPPSPAAQFSSDTKAGTLVGTDRWGNKYYENLAEELPLRTRWIDYKDYELDASQIDPGWHAWISYSVDKPPTEDAILTLGARPWEEATPRINYTQSRGAYRPYSTVKPKYSAWVPVAKSRSGEAAATK